MKRCRVHVQIIEKLEGHECISRNVLETEFTKPVRPKKHTINKTFNEVFGQHLDVIKKFVATSENFGSNLI